MAEIMMPKEAGKYIAEHSKDVQICQEGVKKTASLVSIIFKTTFSAIRKNNDIIFHAFWGN